MKPDNKIIYKRPIIFWNDKTDNVPALIVDIQFNKTIFLPLLFHSDADWTDINNFYFLVSFTDLFSGGCFIR